MCHVSGDRSAQKMSMPNFYEVNYMVNRKLTISRKSVIKPSVKNEKNYCQSKNSILISLLTV